MLKHANSSNSYNILFTFLEFLASVLFIYLVAVTFGASLFLEDFKQTLFFSLFMAVLCVAPSIVLFEHQDLFSLFNRLFLKKVFFDDVEYRCARTSVCAVVGAWLGALVIPLDWDRWAGFVAFYDFEFDLNWLKLFNLVRWWQEWPISCCIGKLKNSGFRIGQK